MVAALAERAPMAGWFGPVLVFTFCLSQALRDVYFGHVFQRIDVFAVILVAFSLSTLGFGALVAIRSPAQLARLRGQLAAVLAVNLTTALAWSCYFFALARLEPAVVNTVHSGMGPLTVLALAACGSALARPRPLRRGERLAHAGVALSLVALGAVVLAGGSALPQADLAALLLLVVSGASITVSLLYCKRLHDRGIGPEAVTAVRYLLLILLAGGFIAWRGGDGGIADGGELVTLALASAALIVLPLFALQVGIAATPPLTAHVIRSLGPACVFALQQLDGRLACSASTLACILAYSAFAIAGNVAHGWRGERPVAAAGR
jgi:drug/metabolite transporter (DMT)-like permease